MKRERDEEKTRERHEMLKAKIKSNRQSANRKEKREIVQVMCAMHVNASNSDIAIHIHNMSHECIIRNVPRDL